MKNFILLIVLFAGTCTATFPQEVKWSGFGAAGYRNFNKQRIIEYNQETYFSAKVQADVKINKDIDGQIDIRGNSQDQQMELREVSVTFGYIDRMNFRFGHLKKPFTAEQLESEEDLVQIDRSNLANELSRMGYGGRSVGIMTYYNSTGKPDDLPYSYHAFLFKNNSLQQGLNLRYRHHFDDDFSAAISYFFLHTGGDFPLVTSAVSPGLYYYKKAFTGEIELVLAQNPVEGARRKAIKENSSVVFWGTRILAAVEFETGAEVIRKIEPLFMISYYQPEMKYVKTHSLQFVIGSNFYFDKKVRIRLNGDFLLTRNRFFSKYSLNGSVITLELQLRF